MIKKWEEYCKEIHALPEKEQHEKIFLLSLLWEDDYDIFRGLSIVNNIKFEMTREQHEESCRKQLEDEFGYAGIFTKREPPKTIDEFCFGKGHSWGG